eukprot:1195987-Prorocentrum_minimum.AAC.2
MVETDFLLEGHLVSRLPAPNSHTAQQPHRPSEQIEKRLGAYTTAAAYSYSASTPFAPMQDQSRIWMTSQALALRRGRPH